MKQFKIKQRTKDRFLSILSKKLTGPGVIRAGESTIRAGKNF